MNERKTRFVVKHSEIPSPDEFVLKLIEETVSRRKLDEILRELRALREMTQLANYIQLPPPSAVTFPEPYRYETVGAGETKILFDLDIPGEYSGAIVTHLGNNWFPNTWFTLDVDHRPVLEPKIERQIAPVTEPTEQHRFIARKNVRWVAHNGDTSEHTFEILINGFFLPRKL